MEMKLKDDFIRAWQNYFNNAELPVTLYYTNEEGHADLLKTGPERFCIMSPLVRVRHGASIAFSSESVICPGGMGCLGFSSDVKTNPEPDLEYFLSYVTPGKVEGERFKKSPEIVREQYKNAPKFIAPAKYAVFKRWDKLEAPDNPQVAIFFVGPDALSGLYNLANFDTADPNAVIAPWGSGCSSIIQSPYLEKDSPNPKAIIGLFDTSARPFTAPDELTFAVPMNRFVSMVENMEESFLITKSWKAIQKRIMKDPDQDTRD
jgi:Uncharacterised ArCR, COG2043